MLTQVEISNYRGFKTYKMSGLSRVNLFVGKNNCGKTAALEAVQFLASGGDPSVILEVARRRGEIVVGRIDRAEELVDIAHFFHGHSIITDFRIGISGDNGFSPVEFSILEQRVSDSGQQQSPNLVLQIKGSNSNDDLRQPSIARHPPQHLGFFRISREGGATIEPPRKLHGTGMRHGPNDRPVRFIGPESLNPFELAVMWDEVTLSGQERDVASAMRILEENLESLHFLTGMLASGYSPSRGGVVVGMKGQDMRVPLGSMGDGMRRLMAIGTSLAFAKEGCLFVDEIDTGLHYSVMSDMWKLIIGKALASNIQVFATTHSWDCIEGLSAFCQIDSTAIANVAIHKIDRAIPHSIPFTGDAIVRMTKADIDPR